LSTKIQDRLRAHAERMSKAMPGVTFTVADAIRTILVDGLDKAERGSRRKKARS
jgi:hypothetical protein